VEGLTRDVRVVSGHGLNDNADATKQRITLQKDFCRELTFEHNREFDKIACGYTATRGAADGNGYRARHPVLWQEWQREANPGSFGEAVFVVQQLGMIEIRTLDLCRGTIGDRPDVGGERFRIVFWILS
jgi:hypothetical protein